MSELPSWARDALAGIYDPCCREKGISVLDMGLVRSVQVEDGVARVELLLTSSWCPFAAGVLTEVKEQILGQPGISDADVSIVWDEAWTTDRLSPRGPGHPALPAAARGRGRPGRVHPRPPTCQGAHSVCAGQTQFDTS